MKHTVISRPMSIQRALEWAFRDECARLEFDEIAETAGSVRVGVDSIWVLMQRGLLGCQIDGGGQSEPASDAQVIASILGQMPMEHGGRSMAISMAEMARGGMVPDYMRDASPAYHPEAVSQNRYGWTAKTEDSAHLGSRGWQPVERKGRKGRVMQEPVLYCPVYVSPTASQIARARRQYLQWWGALLWLRSEISRFMPITEAMPPLSPWRKTDVRPVTPNLADAVLHSERN